VEVTLAVILLCEEGYGIFVRGAKGIQKLAHVFRRKEPFERTDIPDYFPTDVILSRPPHERCFDGDRFRR
jgi:hypothetical protein